MTKAISRRSLIIGTGAIIGCMAVGGIAKAAIRNEELIRPPGGQDLNSLLAACIKCDRCRSACPKNAIALASIEEGFLNSRTPKMNFHLGSCDFCSGKEKMACIDACPTEALSSGFDPNTNKIGVAKVITDECLLYRSGSSKCSKQCIDACNYDAIFLKDGKLSVNEDKCNGCGACTFACPSASYGTYTGSGMRGVEIKPAEGI